MTINVSGARNSTEVTVRSSPGPAPSRPKRDRSTPPAAEKLTSIGGSPLTTQTTESAMTPANARLNPSLSTSSTSRGATKDKSDPSSKTLGAGLSLKQAVEEKATKAPKSTRMKRFMDSPMQEKSG
jgi:hypothetical protein